jgi:uncharacterized protein YwgA
MKYKKLPAIIGYMHININTWQGRRITQNLICLLQLLGTKIPYKFSLYICGVYSPELARDLTELSKKKVNP